MHWRPRPQKPEGEWVEDRLRHILARKLWDHDGSIADGPTALGRDMLPYLQGLADADVEGAAELIAAIQKYVEIEVEITR